MALVSPGWRQLLPGTTSPSAAASPSARARIAAAAVGARPVLDLQLADAKTLPPGEERRRAAALLDLARASYRLRDDDNILMDLLTPYRFRTGGRSLQRRIVTNLQDRWQIVALVLNIFQLILLARVLITWFPDIDRNNPVVRLLYDITEPILQPVRDILPPSGMMDLSPLVVFLVIMVIERLLIAAF